jgi:hypothetical protein
MQLNGSGTPHAAFLKESRIRGHVQCSVQEIRVAPIFFGPGTLPRQAGTPVQFPSQRKRCLEGNNPSAAEAELILKAFNVQPEGRTLQKSELLGRPVGHNLVTNRVGVGALVTN